MARHVPLISTDSPPICPHCERIAKARAHIDPYIPDLRSFTTTLRDLEEQMHHLQRSARAIESEWRKAVDQVCDDTPKHPHCGLCSLPVGPGHASAELHQEPHGSVLVCEECCDLLSRTKRTAAEQMRIYLKDGQEAREA